MFEQYEVIKYAWEGMLLKIFYKTSNQNPEIGCVCVCVW